MTVTETIETKLNAALDPVRMEVVDDSESHRGHGGFREGGESHFNLLVVSEAFAGKSRVARQRLVHVRCDRSPVAKVRLLMQIVGDGQRPPT